jgi:hypothetical protein
MDAYARRYIVEGAYSTQSSGFVIEEEGEEVVEE